MPHKRLGVRRLYRGLLSTGLFFVVLIVWAAIGSPHVAGAAGGLWQGTAEGIRVDYGHSESGNVTSSSASNYQVELTFSFSADSSGQISGGGHGTYTDAHWHLSGVNGDKGSFNCQPPISAEPFDVVVGGHLSGDAGTLTLGIPGATETNEDFKCGADYTGYATSSQLMRESLDAVGANPLPISATHATSQTLTASTGSGNESDQHIWTFSVTPPAQGPNGGSGGGGSGGGGSGGGGNCSLSLTDLAAKPSPGRAGKPIEMSFRVSAPAHAALLVARAGGGATQSVATGSVGEGTNTLVWGGWLGSHAAAAGKYTMTVRATACGTTAKRSLKVTTK